MQVIIQIILEQMSKLSSKIQRIQRVKKHLTVIENEEAIKQNQIKVSLSKKYQFNEKNKEKYMSQKIKTYQIHHQLWENKLQNIKRKNKDQLRIHADKSKKYKEDVQMFWKTKTEQISSISSNKKTQYKINYPSLDRREKKKQDLRVKTEEKDSTIFQLKRENTRNSHKDEIKMKDHHETKTIRFLTENCQQQHHQLVNGRKNGSHFSNKYSTHSMRDHINSKHFLAVPSLDKNKFSENLHNNHQLSNRKFQNNIQNIQLSNNFKNKNKTETDQKMNLSFQKAMKKLDKIQKIKQKKVKRLKQNNQILSPCKPRKAIDADEYRLLRAKSEIKKDNRKLYGQQNAQIIQEESKLNKISTVEIRNHTLSKQVKHQIAQKTNQNRLSISQNFTRQQQIQGKQIDSLLQSRLHKWKKDKIVRAIRDKIFKVKLQQMQKIKQKQTF